jgi:metallo-beta-lactamase family protein
LALVDCGLFQGGRPAEQRNFNTKLYRPEELSAIVVTHAHMDHGGLVPGLVSRGFRGPIYATEATCALLKLLWQDSAHIQLAEANWKNRKNYRQGKEIVEPLYYMEDVERASELLVPLKARQRQEIESDWSFEFITAGHILGAASVLMTVKEANGVFNILFSGDIGRVGQLLIQDPEIPPRSDLVFMETTYGNRLHKSREVSENELIAVVQEGWRQGGKVLIPAFAVERTQEILVVLAKAWHKGLIPKYMPIILDSPLAISASEVFLAHPELFDEETAQMAKTHRGPLAMTSLKATKTVEESTKINEIEGSAVIIAGAGMANAGRILHHFKHNLWRPQCQVIFVGFQAQGTTGRRLIEGAKSVKIFREEVLVKAKIHTIGGFSGHADQSELLNWLGPQVHENLTTVLVHGEEKASLDFQKKLIDTFPQLTTQVPHWLDFIDLARRATVERPKAEKKMPPLSYERFEGERQKALNLVGRMELICERLTDSVKPLDNEQATRLERLLNQVEEIILQES